MTIDLFSLTLSLLLFENLASILGGVGNYHVHAIQMFVAVDVAAVSMHASACSLTSTCHILLTIAVHEGVDHCFTLL